jgi:hypothetical protein
VDDVNESSDETFEETVEAPAPDSPSTEQVAYWQKRAEKAQAEAVSRRVQLRRYEVAAEHGVDAKQIPDWVPADKLSEFVTQFASKSETTATEPAETSEPVEAAQEAPPTEAEQNLAAANKGPSTGVTTSGFTQDDLLQIAMTNPERYDQLRQQGVSLDKLSWGPDK